eukprot:8093060-Pyramimonas_sp.AAC.1
MSSLLWIAPGQDQTCSTSTISLHHTEHAGHNVACLHLALHVDPAVDVSGQKPPPPPCRLARQRHTHPPVQRNTQQHPDPIA